ncbi:unnamed protein product [Rotaria sp. Silwood2]|nr:unnamed protein product [Rotaria sp. Silwood2]
MSGNEYENSDTTDDECYDTYYDDTDPFQDDNNNNYTTNINANDPEQFEYKVSLLNEVQARFEPSTFSSSYIHTSSIPDICSICFKNQTNFESLVCNHAFCHDCWSQYIDTKFQYQNCINYECMKCDKRIPHNFVLQHLSSDNRKELYKKLVVKAMIQVEK